MTKRWLTQFYFLLCLNIFLCSICLPTHVNDFYLVLNYHILKYAVKLLNAHFLLKPFKFTSNTDRIHLKMYTLLAIRATYELLAS